ncbi:metal-dependent hydrolase [Candidatus Babeliales bacterium]|nr:metal-dependent hydrolase [Candidatus Babeliales bacterium]
MPSYKGHLVGGAATFFVTYQAATKVFGQQPFTTKQIVFALTFCLLGSLFPDIDTKSLGQRVFYSLLTVAVFAAIALQHWALLSFLSVLGLLPLLVNHRGMIHTVWFVTMFPLAVTLFITRFNPTLSSMAWPAYSYFVVGALSHLFLDYGVWRTVKTITGRR